MVGFAHRFRPRYAWANLGHPSSSYWLLAMTQTPKGPAENYQGCNPGLLLATSQP
jgi:hypothetical protein